MSLIVEFELQTPILRTAAEAIRKIRLEEVYSTDTGEAKLLFWAFGDEFGEFEAALADDESVEEFSVLETLSDRNLYGVLLSDVAASKLTYPIAAEHNVVIDEIVVTDETVVRARVPSRDALLSYRDSCLERGVGFQIERMYNEQNTETEQYGVTERQRAALLTALDRGYFDVPRTVALAEIAAELDISDQALSARLRRGQANLLSRTLADDPS